MCEANHIPKVLNGKVLQARRNGSVLIADVICNGNFVRSTSKSSSVVCSSLTGWLFDDVCNEGVLIGENKIVSIDKKYKSFSPIFLSLFLSPILTTRFRRLHVDVFSAKGAYIV